MIPLNQLRGMISLNHMFRHENKELAEEIITDKPKDAPEIKGQENIAPVAIKHKETLEELVEKNLKWSQIIYEQNRKINNKLLWAAVASWLYLIILVVPIILGLLFLPPLLGSVFSQYGSLLNGTSVTSSPSTVDNFLKNYLNLDPANQDQVKAILK